MSQRHRAPTGRTRPPARRVSLRIARGILLTLVHDGNVFRFLSWSHLRGRRLRRPSSRAQARIFRSWEAAAEFFRVRYHRALPEP